MGTFIAVVSGSIQLALATFGAYMSLRRPSSTPHVRWFIVFMVLGASGIVVTAIQAHHASVVQEDLRASIEKVPKTITSEFLHSGANVVEVKRKQWSLTPATTSLLATQMAPFADGTDRNDLIAVIFWDQDSIRLGNELKAAFRASGWKIATKGFWHVEDQTTYKAGLFLLKHSDDDEPKGLRQLAAILDDAGMPPTIAIDEKIPSGRFRILIGGRGD